MASSHFFFPPRPGTSCASTTKTNPPHPSRTVLERLDHPLQQSVLPPPAVGRGQNRLAHRRVTTVVRVQIGWRQLVLFLVVPLRLAVAAGEQKASNGVLVSGVKVGHGIVRGLKPRGRHVRRRHVRPVQLGGPPLGRTQLRGGPQEGRRHLLPKVRASGEAL